MSSSEYWGDAELDLTPTKSSSKEIEPAVPMEELAIPDKPSTAWVKAQLPNAVWSANRSSLNPTLIARMAELSRKGMPRNLVMARFGFSAQTTKTWEHKGMLGQEPYALWLQVMLSGSAQKQEELLGQVWRATAVDWKAAAWWLGKMDPETFSDNKGGVPQTTVNITQGDSNESKIEINKLDDEGTRKILDLFRQVPGALPDIDGEVVEESDASGQEG